MKINFLVIFAATLFIISGCSLFMGKPSTVILRHSESLDFVNCQVGKWETPEDYKKNEQCVEDYKKKGYIVWGER